MKKIILFSCLSVSFLFINNLFCDYYALYKKKTYHSKFNGKKRYFIINLINNKEMSSEQKDKESFNYYGVSYTTALRLNDESDRFSYKQTQKQLKINPNLNVFENYQDSYFENQIVWERGLDYYLDMKNIMDSTCIVYFDNSPKEDIRNKYKVFENVGRSPLGYIENCFLMLNKTKGDSILVSSDQSEYRSNHYHPAINDSFVQMKSKIIGSGKYLVNEFGNYELLFVLTKEPVYYKNVIGKFYHTGFSKNVKFFNQNYSNVYQVYWVSKSNSENIEEYVRLIWFNETFDILRMEFVYDHRNTGYLSFEPARVDGYYKVYD